MKQSALSCIGTLVVLVLLHCNDVEASPTHLKRLRSKHKRIKSFSSEESDEDIYRHLPRKDPPVEVSLPPAPHPTPMPQHPVSPIPIETQLPRPYYFIPVNYPPQGLPTFDQGITDNTAVSGNGNSVQKSYDLDAQINIPISLGG